MFISYQNLYQQCQYLSSDDNATTLTNFKFWLNQAIGKAYKVLDAEWFYESVVYATADGTYSYPLPYNCQKIHTINVEDSNDYKYIATEFPGTENQWDALDKASESDYPRYFFVKSNSFEIYPTSSTDDLDMTVKYKVRKKDMTEADYTTSTIKTATFGSTAIVGNSLTAWDSSMDGKYIKITDDGDWYQIASITSATTLTLAREYGGASIAGGTSAYTIGEMSLLPEDYQDLPIDYALWQYYMQKKEFDAADRYKQNWLEGLLDLKQSGGNQTTSGVLQDNIILPGPNDNIVLSEAE
jgi:hypothetical protein